MARQRDYRAEYQRRIELARQRAESTGRTFDRKLARGHSLARTSELARGSVKRAEWNAGVQNAIEQMGVTKTHALLRAKRRAMEAYANNDSSVGRALYEALNEDYYEDYDLDDFFVYYHEK